MAYEKNTPWVNGDAVNSPLSAARLNNLETQYDKAVEYADGLIDRITPGLAKVQVTTGSEARPNAVLVVWVGGLTQPTSMAEGDFWFARVVAEEVAPAITLTTLGALTVGTAKTAAITATGTAPINFSITSGFLPEGMALSGGNISGTPTTAGAYSFTLRASNAAGYDDQTLSGNVTDPIPTSNPEALTFWGDSPPLLMGPEVGATTHSDGGDGLKFGSRFYVGITRPAGIDVIGVRVWNPPTADSTFLAQPVLAELYAQDFTGSGLPRPYAVSGALRASKTYTGTRQANTWTEVLFDSPVHFTPPNASTVGDEMITASLMIGAGNHYTYVGTGPADPPQPTPLPSPVQADVYLAEVGLGRGFNNIPGAGDVTRGYPIDIIWLNS